MSEADIACPDSLVKFSLSLNTKLYWNETGILKCEADEKSNKLQSQQNTPTFAKTANSTKCLYECPTCQKTFSKKSQFQYHKKTHRLKPYQCSSCSKSFLTKQRLKVHSIIHTNAELRPFSCQQCSKNFQTKQNLHNHQNIHLGKKPFQCNECLKSFSEKSTLRKHMTTHNKEKKYTCTLCDEKFTQISSQQRHLAKFHNTLLGFPHFDDFLPSLGAEIVTNELMLLENSS